MKFACVFPGQGSQSIGMMAEFSEKYSEVKDIFTRASDALGYDLAGIISAGPVEELNKTECTQPAMLTAGVAAWKVLRMNTELKPALLAGHSLGEYTALVCSGAMKFEDAVKLVAERGRLMQNAVPEGIGAMAAILGLDDDQVISICEQATSDIVIVQAVNFNSPGQVVIAGHDQAVEKAMLLAKEAKAKRALKLPVSVPSHSSLMTDAAKQLGEVLSSIEIKSPEIPVLHNVDAKTHSDPSEIKQCLQQQLHNPVLWVDTVNNLIAQGIDSIVECGPGKVLAGLNRRIDKSATNYTIDSVENFNTFKSALEE
ncbi:MAG: ACP S-malonyltransferase [Gammaproteobacteria bacterium]|nr:ACP S-malonyltransferase [Gammaproteobacteria bacterium]MCW8910478.1 ACP S-malonyltransferase [Gammaproteobacteria bacterium]MCW9004987.1 ACP S-malonyltransferase [Gammaproteobacteria bacterium]MCW9055909.1 ACP S-malonyltransferase [Gammaproteobacteria bacterium]